MRWETQELEDTAFRALMELLIAMEGWSCEIGACNSKKEAFGP